ncbi:MAG: glutamine--fructose-6-phosphate aminotransferase [Betaproteobacteria bacterium RIFCSPLOWO2_02_67_12]|nr:MAG: glutamine--fructose-6-phosphate aminotransferase [Betaproteobacteria bacterium RIFCSPLOWO2_02_67_12]OGA60773.1 MAG: glutamine--fructose-6-phosphate aminotransferase [Betaproteobacteria bacterium RIFCSPLOWO2_12_FULL_67_28]
MCGIVGAAARRDIIPVLLEGLRRLEYRGYDSCGVAALHHGALARVRSVARVADLAGQVASQALAAETGIAHTRWATHGAPLTHNAHPLFSRGEIALVHNGIIENFEELRDELKARGYAFESQTDTEVIAHLVHSLYAGDLFDAVRRAAKRLSGAYAIAVMSEREPHVVVGARAGSPLVVGVGDGEMFLASDALALAGTTERIAYLEEGDVAEIRLDGYRVLDQADRPVKREARIVKAGSSAVELGPYRHFMQKEIFEQPQAVADTLEGVESVAPALFGEGAAAALQRVKSVLLLACGTSYYAGLTAKCWIESLARLPVQVEIASEYRYRDSVPDPDALVVVVSQSGETADTLAALRHARTLGQPNTLAICNVATSAMMRETQLAFLTHAGVEIGVASTKAFTTQLVALFLLAMTLAKLRGRLSVDEEQQHLRRLRHLPKALGAALALETQVMAWSERFAAKEHALFLGRGLHYPIALEGALKLKEISYIHAEAYPAGELKHGPLALVTSEMPVVTVAPNDALLEKLKSNMQEVRARGGELYVLTDAETRIAGSEGINVIRLPEHYGLLSPILHVVPLQLLAYHTALARGTDVDKPRNLAKSVTVE